jgi:hypothetical protein
VFVIALSPLFAVSMDTDKDRQRAGMHPKGRSKAEDGADKAQRMILFREEWRQARGKSFVGVVAYRTAGPSAQSIDIHNDKGIIQAR